MALIDNDYTFFGVSATYTAVGGQGASVTVIIDEEFDAQDSEFGSVRADAEISVRQSQVAARPTYRATFATTDGANTTQTWYVVRDGVKEKRTMKDFGAEWVCKVVRNEKAVPR